MQVDERPGCAEIRRHLLRKLEFLAMTLSVVEGDGSQRVSLGSQRVRHGGRIEATGYDDDGAVFSHQRASSVSGCTIRIVSDAARIAGPGARSRHMTVRLSYNAIVRIANEEVEAVLLLILIIVVVVLLIGGGGYFWRAR